MAAVLSTLEDFAIRPAMSFESVPNPKIAILCQNDDLGKDFVAGFT